MEARARELHSSWEPFLCQKVLTGPLLGAAHTAQLAGYAVVATRDTDLMEWDYGSYEGRRTAEIRTERPGWNLFEDGCPKGESLEEVAARADRVVTGLRASANNVLVFAHRDILRIVLARWINLAAIEGRRFMLAPTSISVLSYDHDLDESIIRMLNS